MSGDHVRAQARERYVLNISEYLRAIPKQSTSRPDRFVAARVLIAGGADGPPLPKQPRRLTTCGKSRVVPGNWHSLALVTHRKKLQGPVVPWVSRVAGN